MRDRLGMFCSGLCLFHCLLGPMLLAAGGLALLGDERVHQALLMPAWALAILSFPAGYRRHRGIIPLVMGAGGALSMVVAVAAGGSWETPLSVIGGAGLIGGHWLNRRRLACDCAVVSADGRATP